MLVNINNLTREEINSYVHKVRAVIHDDDGNLYVTNMDNSYNLPGGRVENGEDLIDLFYIDKKYQGKGIGTQILKEQLKQDEENNVNTVLQVFKENPAKRLYEKVGFEIYDETEHHYKMIRKIKE